MRRLWVIFSALMLSSCAADVTNYTPALDPDLQTLQTQNNLKRCREIVAALPQQSIWGAVGDQVGASSGNAWVTAAELGTSTALSTAAGATAVGSVIGTHSALTSRQDKAESEIRLCMQNRKEAILDKP